MKYKELLSKKEKEFFRMKKEWISGEELRHIEIAMPVPEKQAFLSVRDFLKNLTPEVMDGIDRNQVEVCVDCGKIFKTTFEYKGSIPKCMHCGKVLSSIPKEFELKFRRWNNSYEDNQ